MGLQKRVTYAARLGGAARRAHLLAMSRTASLFGSALFLFIAPGLVAGVTPWWITGWRVGPALFAGGPAFGWLMLALGAAMLLECFVRFAWIGRGTPAPVAPTQTLVTTGLYRFVRNPMYVAVLSLILGQALILSSTALLLYAVAVWIAFQTFIFFYEEPTLGRTYGAAYDEYRRHVPAWLPRLTPWRGSE